MRVYKPKIEKTENKNMNMHVNKISIIVAVSLTNMVGYSLFSFHLDTIAILCAQKKNKRELWNETLSM